MKNRCLLLKNEADLTESENLELADLLKNSACLGIAYELKEELRDIYETSPTVKIGLKRLKSWLNSARIIFGQAVNSIENHLLEISHYFVSKTTSGVMEGINNRIKLIIRQSYGFKIFESLQEKLLACLFK